MSLQFVTEQSLNGSPLRMNEDTLIIIIIIIIIKIIIVIIIREGGNSLLTEIYKTCTE